MIKCLTFLLLCQLMSYAQSGRVTYTQILNLNNSPDTSIALLIYDANSSLYNYGKKATGANSAKYEGNESSGHFVLRDEEGFLYFADYKNRVFSSKEYLLTKRVLVIDPFEDVDWKIEDGLTKIIKGYLAHQATGQFRGRNYTVWFSHQIPLEYGPWKLKGLPGLILEAYDEEHVLNIEFNSLEEGAFEISIPKLKPLLSQKEYVSSFKKKLSQLEKFLKANASVPNVFSVQSKAKIHVLERSLYED